jgi:hypothetical protein
MERLPFQKPGKIKRSMFPFESLEAQKRFDEEEMPVCWVMVSLMRRSEECWRKLKTETIRIMMTRTEGAKTKAFLLSPSPLPLAPPTGNGSHGG